MLVMVKQPGCVPVRKYIRNNLEDLQMLVGGYIEIVPVNSLRDYSIALLCNEEGRMLGLPENFVVYNERNNAIIGNIVGDLVFVGVAPNGEFISLNPDQLDYLYFKFCSNPLKININNSFVDALIV